MHAFLTPPGEGDPERVRRQPGHSLEQVKVCCNLLLLLLGNYEYMIHVVGQNINEQGIDLQEEGHFSCGITLCGWMDASDH